MLPDSFDWSGREAENPSKLSNLQAMTSELHVNVKSLRRTDEELRIKVQRLEKENKRLEEENASLLKQKLATEAELHRARREIEKLR